MRTIGCCDVGVARDGLVFSFQSWFIFILEISNGPAKGEVAVDTIIFYKMA